MGILTETRTVTGLASAKFFFKTWHFSLKTWEPDTNHLTASQPQNLIAFLRCDITVPFRDSRHIVCTNNDQHRYHINAPHYHNKYPHKLKG